MPARKFLATVAIRGHCRLIFSRRRFSRRPQRCLLQTPPEWICFHHRGVLDELSPMVSGSTVRRRNLSCSMRRECGINGERRKCAANLLRLRTPLRRGTARARSSTNIASASGSTGCIRRYLHCAIARYCAWAGCRSHFSSCPHNRTAFERHFALPTTDNAWRCRRVARQ
jgi:hypothetical protein